MWARHRAWRTTFLITRALTTRPCSTAPSSRSLNKRPQKKFHEYVLHSFSTFSLIELTVRNHIVHLICRRSRHDKRGRVCERIKALDEYGQEGAGSRFQSYVRVLHKICTEDSSGHPLEEGHEEQPKHDLVATDEFVSENLKKVKPLFTTGEGQKRSFGKTTWSKEGLMCRCVDFVFR